MSHVHFHVVTLFPEYFEGPLSAAIFGKALNKDLVAVSIHDLRTFSDLKHNQVDDEAYGGGPGMVLRIEPLVASLKHIKGLCSPKTTCSVAFTPAGHNWDQGQAISFANRIETERSLTDIILYCGRYEGFDERFLAHYVDFRFRVSDVVYMGGEVASLVFMESLARLLPNVVGNPDSLLAESFMTGSADYPVYTRPNPYEGHSVPPVLTSGNHQAIEAWREQEAERIRQKYWQED